jgi:two-component system cell cycle response regulator
MRPRVVALSLVPAVLGGIVALLAPSSSALWQPLLGLATGLPLFIAFGAAIAGGAERRAWIAVAAGMGLTVAAGKLGMPGGQSLPARAWSAGDVVWLARFPVLYGGLALLIVSRSPAFGLRQVLDGLIGAFAAAALTRMFVMPWVVAGAQADATTVSVHAALPLLDVAVVGFLAGAAALNAWRPAVWLPLALDMALFVGCEIVDTHAGLAHPGVPMSWATYPGYLAAAWLIAAAVSALRASPGRAAPRRRPVGPSLALAAGAVATLVGVAAGADHAPLVIALAAASLLAGLWRQALTLRDNDRLLALTEAEAATDALTGLSNRRSLTADLKAAVLAATPSRPLTVALFDLDGFKHYNDTFGHPAGDALLQRVGRALDEAVAPPASAYRMGGDEFCVLVEGDADAAEVVAAAGRALQERGEGFVIGASRGTATVPGDAADASEALRVADHRMYAEKAEHGRRRPSALRATASLLQLLRERDPSLRNHTDEVAVWSAAVAQALGASPELVEQACLGGELHDIGKSSIPDAILDKPGPLTDEEWDFMRRHTVIGERILLADAALAHIASVARSHHERWDGGGYPDGLAGEEIPLAARIVSVCDSYEAMVADRPYRAARSHEEAATELRRCAGGQFDPAVVDAFLAVLDRTETRRAA